MDAALTRETVDDDTAALQTIPPNAMPLKAAREIARQTARATEEWVSSRGIIGEPVRNVCKRLATSGIASEQWVEKLASLESNGELENFLLSLDSGPENSAKTTMSDIRALTVNDETPGLKQHPISPRPRVRARRISSSRQLQPSNVSSRDCDCVAARNDTGLQATPDTKANASNLSSSPPQLSRRRVHAKVVSRPQTANNQRERDAIAEIDAAVSAAHGRLLSPTKELETGLAWLQGEKECNNNEYTSIPGAPAGHLQCNGRTAQRQADTTEVLHDLGSTVAQPEPELESAPALAQAPAPALRPHCAPQAQLDVPTYEFSGLPNDPHPEAALRYCQDILSLKTQWEVPLSDSGDNLNGVQDLDSSNAECIAIERVVGQTNSQSALAPPMPTLSVSTVNSEVHSAEYTMSPPPLTHSPYRRPGDCSPSPAMPDSSVASFSSDLSSNLGHIDSDRRPGQPMSARWSQSPEGKLGENSLADGILQSEFCLTPKARPASGYAECLTVESKNKAADYKQQRPPKQCNAKTVLEILSERFPTCSRDSIQTALHAARGHGGRAALILRSLERSGKQIRKGGAGTLCYIEACTDT